MPRLLPIAFFICFCISIGFAQDTAKNSNHAPLVIPAQHLTKYGHGKYHTVKADSSKLTTAAHASVAVRPDTTKNNRPATKSLRAQYLDLLSQIYHYQQPALIDFWKSTSDTLRQFNNKQKAANIKVISQNKMIDSLKATLLTKDQAIAAKVDEINFVGMSLPLLTYNLIVWGLVVVLAIATFSVIARIASFKNEAHYRTKLYAELEDEFKAYKAKANDKEKKLARELQTERNKLDELLGRG